MPSAHARTEILIGSAGVKRLACKTVFIAGLGGVGGNAAEAIIRAGIGRVILLDHDIVALSNLNRQLVALHSTIGQSKTQVMAKRAQDIAPNIDVIVQEAFLRPDNANEILAQYQIDYVLDCIDSIICKAALVKAAQAASIPIISAMGAGNCLDVRRVRIAQLKDAMGCPLARELRRHLRRAAGDLSYPVVFSDEPRQRPLPHQPVSSAKLGRSRAVNGTISYLPALFGTMMAGFALQYLLKTRN